MSLYRYDTRYAFLTGIIRAYEPKMLTPATIDRLKQADSFALAVRILKDTVYRDFFKEESNTENFIKILDLRRKKLFEFIDKYSFHKEIGQILRLGYDYHNIKVLLKKNIFELSDTNALFDVGTINIKEITDIFKDETYNKLPDFMHEAVNRAVQLYYSAKHSILIDLSVDKIMFQDLLNKSESLASPLIKNHIRLTIDLANIKTALRIENLSFDTAIRENIFIHGGDIDIKAIVLPGAGKTEAIIKVLDQRKLHRLSKVTAEFKENPFAIEREIDNTLTDNLKPSIFLVWGIEPVFVFGFAVEMELKILRIILEIKKYGFETEWIEKRLPETLYT